MPCHKKHVYPTHGLATVHSGGQDPVQAGLVQSSPPFNFSGEKLEIVFLLSLSDLRLLFFIIN